MKKLLILALASAFVAAANADVVSSWGATSSGPSSATWTNAPSAENGVLKVDADAGDMAVLTPSGTAPAPQVKTVVTVVAQFDTINDVNELAEPGEGAKTAFTVANVSGTPRYFYWDGSDWASLDDTVTAVTASAITVTIELDNSTPNTTKAAFKVNDTQIGQTKTIASNAEIALSALAFAGTGTLKSVDATVTPAYATYNNTRYETMANAVTARNGGNGVITVHNPTGSYPGGIIQNSTTHELYFPRTTTADQDGTAEHPYEIADVDDLIALKDAVAVNAGIDKCYVQTSNIDLDNVVWPGITDFKGTYDGGTKTISNLKFSAGTYRGLFNKITGATICNLTINNATFDADNVDFNTDEFGGSAFVGKVYGDCTFSNLKATGVVGSSSKPCNHSTSGIATRICTGTSTFNNCENAATIYAATKKIGGLVAIAQPDSGKNASVSFNDCINSGEIKPSNENFYDVGDKKDIAVGSDGAAGIIAYANVATTLTGCKNTGTISCKSNSAAVGALVGKQGDKALSDMGGNKAASDMKMVGAYNSSGTVTGFKYATVDNGVATTVTTLAKDTTYLLEGNVAASETPVFTLAAAGDTIAFDAALGYTFAGTIGSSVAGYTTKAATVSSVTTYSLENTQVPVATKTATTLVSVPQTCTASTLINTSNRDSGDLLQVLNKSTNKYYQWSYDGAGGWTPNNVVTGSDIVEETPAASTITLTRGEAVWVTRKDTSKAILLNAAYSDEPVTVTVVKGYNLIAPLPKEGSTTVEIDEVVADDATGKDKVFIPAEGKAPYNLDFKDGNWGYDKYTIKNGQLEKVRITDVTIPAGTGFFYINNGDAAKSVTLGSED